MYKCPNSACEAPEHQRWFFREVPAIAIQQLDADTGSVLRARYEDGVATYAPAKCSHCGARAEWIDARQTELFAIEPTVEDGVYTDNDDMRVHAPQDDQMDTYANHE